MTFAQRKAGLQLLQYIFCNYIFWLMFAVLACKAPQTSEIDTVRTPQEREAQTLAVAGQSGQCGQWSLWSLWRPGRSRDARLASLSPMAAKTPTAEAGAAYRIVRRRYSETAFPSAGRALLTEGDRFTSLHPQAHPWAQLTATAYEVSIHQLRFRVPPVHGRQ
ncbi:hypothetical protein BO71DRAFT_397510 [Aspergillus ellipticus CBS 707.79]|uniref:Uncharacterized protein n=1 Tax=Aspergillus ellipticus CBS 707.79 TaxID=1448320 RepID=A0A319EWM5_9EURO|nr:hypothetical protein BO71DRAFT_397510 [Aspergillus ellipticus CBS 707.79]